MEGAWFLKAAFLTGRSSKRKEKTQGQPESLCCYQRLSKADFMWKAQHSPVTKLWPELQTKVSPVRVSEAKEKRGCPRTPHIGARILPWLGSLGRGSPSLSNSRRLGASPCRELQQLHKAVLAGSRTSHGHLLWDNMTETQKHQEQRIQSRARSSWKGCEQVSWMRQSRVKISRV